MQTINRASGLAPIFISLSCVVLVLAATAKYCAVPHVDEGAAAHIFQLLMVAQLPIALAFVLTRGRKPFLQILPVLALQTVAWGVAWFGVYVLKL